MRSLSNRSRTRRREPLAAKVPEITVMFWILKILTTGMGEAMSDFLGQRSVPLAGAIGILGVGPRLCLQLRRPSTTRRPIGSR